MKSIREYDKQNIEQSLIKTKRDKSTQSVQQPQKGNVYRVSHLV